ncbi:hypothetical protein HPB50_005106 [Hyalomma asiaticum]|uniref:Uncharacterized protein n=1 Tax=Hyalomma asiaticum TaxID=266040 RepID=A0ACB7STI0_HYAAI|nr:hypothetical protein HPB50_005106 [Hyalomma asiaticum]
MSGESSLAFIRNIYTNNNILTRGFSKGNAGAALVVLSALGVCGVVGVLAFIMLASKDDVADQLTSVTVKAVSMVLTTPVRSGATHLQEESRHLPVRPKHSASLSAGELEGVVRKRGKKRNAAKKASSGSPSHRGTEAAGIDITVNRGDSEKGNGSTVIEKDALVLVHDEGYDRGWPKSKESNSDETNEDTGKRSREDTLGINAGTSGIFASTSTISRRSTRATSMPTSTVISASVSRTPEVDAPSTKKASSTITSPVPIERKAYVVGTTAGNNANAKVELNSHPSSTLLFCFYDDRSAIRSPGFSVYDFPVQLCTDVAFCCVDVSAQGRVVVSKNLKLFLQVLGHEFLPANHLYVTLGGHRVLIHHLDAALQNTARFATELSEEVKRLGAGGLAIYLEDVELLKHAFRVHDLIMAVRGVSVAVVLPRDLRQQVRYYHTEVYANTKDMLVISPPSQGYGGRQPRPAFATCPHPRRSIHEGSSLEFIYQLSRTLLSSGADGASDYMSPSVGAGAKLLPPPRYVIGVSFGGLKFQLKNRSLHDVGSPATFVRAVPYRDICKQPWRHWNDNMSECFVAWDGDRGWMSSLGPGSVGFTAELANGLAVFDIDYDDHSGECGDKFPVLRALRAALFSQGTQKLK